MVRRLLAGLIGGALAGSLLFVVASSSLPASAATTAAAPPPFGTTTTTVGTYQGKPKIVTFCTENPAPPWVQCSTSTSVLYLKPDYYYPVTTEGREVCGVYPAGTSVHTTLNTPTGGQPGPTLTSDSQGCVNVSIRYVGGTQFEVYLGEGKWSLPYSMAKGLNALSLSGTDKYGNHVITDVEFVLGHVAGQGNAVAVKGKQVSWLTWTVLLALLADLLLFLAGGALMWMARRNQLPVAGADQGAEEEPGTGDDFFGDYDESEDELDEPPPLPALPEAPPRNR